MNTTPIILYSSSTEAPKNLPDTPALCMTSAAIVMTVGTIITALVVGVNEVISKAAEAGIVKEMTEVQWASFPFVGAMFAAIMSILFKKDDWRENAGRFIMATVVGVGIPKLMTFLHPALKTWSADPILLIMFGFAWGMVGFALARWAFMWINKRGPEIAQTSAEDWLHRRQKNESGDKTQPLKP